jgi:hypothetical protein
MSGRKQNKNSLSEAEAKNKQDFFWAPRLEFRTRERRFHQPNLVIKWSLTKIIYGT